MKMNKEMPDVSMRPIPGLENAYSASEDGHIWSHRAHKFLKESNSGDGHNIVTIGCDGKQITHKVARLVAMAWIPNPSNYRFCVHRNKSIPEDNSVPNLYWSPCTKTKKRIKDLTTGIVYDCLKDAAAATGLSKSTIDNHCLGRVKNQKFEFVKENEDEE